MRDGRVSRVAGFHTHLSNRGFLLEYDVLDWQVGRLVQALNQVAAQPR